MRRMIRRLLGVRSASADMGAVMREHTAAAVRGFEAGNQRAAEMRDAGMTPEAIMRAAAAEMSPETIAYAELVAKRAFWALYDEDAQPSDT